MLEEKSVIFPDMVFSINTVKTGTLFYSHFYRSLIVVLQAKTRLIGIFNKRLGEYERSNTITRKIFIDNSPKDKDGNT